MSIMKAPDLVTLWCTRRNEVTDMFLTEEDRRRWASSHTWVVEWPRELPDGRFLDMDLRTKRVTYQSEET